MPRHHLKQAVAVEFCLSLSHGHCGEHGVMIEWKEKKN